MATADLHFYDRDSSNYSGEFTDGNRHFFVLEPPHPPKPAPDMQALREAVDAEYATNNALQTRGFHRTNENEDRMRATGHVMHGDEENSGKTPESIVQRFVQSMEMNYDKWREGEGYDLTLIQESDERSRDCIERIIIQHSPRDWRDIEALAMIDSLRARAAIMDAFLNADTKTRMAVHSYARERLLAQDTRRTQIAFRVRLEVTMTLRRIFLKSTVLTVVAPRSFAAAPSNRLVGITVLPEFIQSEGVDGVLRNLIDLAGANAVTTSPYVMEPADEKTGGREPPIDAGAGSVRLLDRPLFGKRELWVRTAPSFLPDKSLYAGLRYQPPAPDALTAREGGKVSEFVKQAKASGLKVYLQVQAASPPGYRVQFSGVMDEDQPRRFDNKIPAVRVDKNGSLASPHILAYTAAMLKDLAKHYPQVDGFRIDWPEYPPYFLDALFVDYSIHAKAAAERLGYSFDAMKTSAHLLHDKLFGNLTNRDLEQVLEGDGGLLKLCMDSLDFPSFVDAMNFRVKLVRELVSVARKALDNAGASHMELVPNAFPPPWNLISGFPFGDWGKIVNGFSVKQYAMHWAMMVRFYGDELLKANSGLDESLLVRALVRLLDIADDEGLPHLADYHYPEPNEPHPCGILALERKIRQAQAAAGETPVFALAHGYGSVEDFRRRLTAASKASRHGFWINRYGYLSDKKLQVVREV